MGGGNDNFHVIPAKAGIQLATTSGLAAGEPMGVRFRADDDIGVWGAQS
ncbi:hypothetical protein HNQ99_001520 [Rhizorhapis suberifaciens]|uniref:Uncharacterized protein n=1 Tax=Rhizorhapis suberifaciens TaxID=13656 RepID=A0A840HT78_9SPHN|nr:hypothetical protein [Rhizorhapis suberifaciens]